MSGILEKFNFYEMDEVLEQIANEYKEISEKKSIEIHLRRCPICGKEVRLMCYEDDGSGILLCVNYEEELDELNIAYGYIHCHNCDAVFCKTATLRELIEWWNDRVPIDVSDLIETMVELKAFYKNRYDEELDSYDRASYEAYDDVINWIEEWSVGIE